MASIDGEKKEKRKKRKRETPDQNESKGSSKVQTESENQDINMKHKHKKNKKNKQTEDINHQVLTEKKKKKKLKERGEDVSTVETSLMDNGALHEVKDRNAPTAESNQGHRTAEDKPAKKKKSKKVKVTHTDCDDMAKDHSKEQSTVTTKHTADPCVDDEESDSMTSAVLMGTKKKRKRKNHEEPEEIDLNILEELKKFDPDIESRHPDIKRKMIAYDLSRFTAFEKEGIAVKRGRFSAAENEQLRQNVMDFMALTGVENPTMLFHTHRFPEERQSILKMKRIHRFYERIAEGIPRSCHDVFTRGTRVFDGRNYKGRFTDDELKALLRFHTIHGNNWKKISELTGRSAFALEKRFFQISKVVGPWSEKEVQKLLRAVRDQIVAKLKSDASDQRTSVVSREMLYKNLPWSEIASKVKTRCWTKCREKWMSLLAVRMSSGAVHEGKKSQEDKIRLIKAMYEMQVEDIADVNWEDLTAVFGDVPPAYVQAKWHKLKVCHVPNWKIKCFADIVDYLYEKVLPRLEEQFKNCDEIELQVDQQESFLLNDIFRDINERDCDDSDKERQGDGDERDQLC